MHQVGISNYLMRKVDAKTTLKLLSQFKHVQSRKRVVVNVETRLHSRHISYRSYHRPLSSRLLSKSWRQRTLVVVYVRETRSHIQREENLQRVFENKVVRETCVPKNDEVPGDWRKLNNEKTRSGYSTPNNIRVIKLRRLRSVGHVTRMGRRYIYIGYWRSNLKERDHLEDQQQVATW